MNYTKGEWRVRENPTDYPDIKTYSILTTNPDAGKSGVSYSGKYLSVAELDCKDDAQLIASAPRLDKENKELKEINKDLYEAIKAMMALIVAQYPALMRSYPYDLMIKALSKVEGK